MLPLQPTLLPLLQRFEVRDGVKTIGGVIFLLSMVLSSLFPATRVKLEHCASIAFQSTRKLSPYNTAITLFIC